MFFTSNLSRSHLRCRLWPLNITCVFDKDSEAANSSIYTMYRQPNRVWVASGWDHLSRQDSYIVLMRRYHQISTRTLPSCTATLQLSPRTSYRELPRQRDGLSVTSSCSTRYLQIRRHDGFAGTSWRDDRHCQLKQLSMRYVQMEVARSCIRLQG